MPLSVYRWESSLVEASKGKIGVDPGGINEGVKPKGRLHPYHDTEPRTHTGGANGVVGDTLNDDLPTGGRGRIRKSWRSTLRRPFVNAGNVCGWWWGGELGSDGHCRVTEVG